MITESKTISITATFNEERTHRFSLKRVWDESQPTATIIMSNASTANLTKGDLTSLLIQNNLSALGYGAVTAVNLFSFMCQKLDLSGNLDDLTCEDNIQQILEAVRDSDITIVAIGTLAKTYKKVIPYQTRLFELLRQYQDKIHTIAAPCGTEELHPLSAKLRASGSWTLVPYKIPDPPPAETKEAKTGKGKPGKKTDKQDDSKIIPLAN